MTECLEVASQGLGVDATVGQRRQIVRVTMQTLTAGCYLEPPEYQIERVRRAGSIEMRMCIEGSFGEWVARDEDKVGAMFTQSSLAEPALMGRREVRLVGQVFTRGRFDEALRLGEVDSRDSHGGWQRAANHFQCITLARDGRQHPIDDAVQERHHGRCGPR